MAVEINSQLNSNCYLLMKSIGNKWNTCFYEISDGKLSPTLSLWPKIMLDTVLSILTVSDKYAEIKWTSNEMECLCLISKCAVQ